jgi:hypothetical protein
MGNGRQVANVRQLQVPTLRYRPRCLLGACNEGVGVLQAIAAPVQSLFLGVGGVGDAVVI